METVAVLDFETTGLSPGWGDRATEIAVTLMRDGQIVDRYQSLMNAGRRIPAEVVALTGITNSMIASAPPADKVMREAAQFVGRHPVVGKRSTAPPCQAPSYAMAGALIGSNSSIRL